MTQENTMKKYMLMMAAAIGLSLVGARDASAYTKTFELGYSTYTVLSHQCSSGTATQFNATASAVLSGFKLAGYRLSNLSLVDIFVGDVNVSTFSFTSGSSGGAILKQNALVSMPVAHQSFSANLVPLYCIAADAAGTTESVLMIELFGYR